MSVANDKVKGQNLFTLSRYRRRTGRAMIALLENHQRADGTIGTQGAPAVVSEVIGCLYTSTPNNPAAG